MTTVASVADHRVSGLDGLRAMAVGAVVAFHTGLVLPGGDIGVDLFMVLSGYLITSLLLGEHATHGRIGIRAFYVRRAIRLYPALIVLCVTLVVVAAIVDTGYQFELNEALLASCAVALLYLSDVAVGWGLWADFGTATPLLHTWSLSIEEHFYLLWAPLLAFMVPRVQIERLTRWLVGLVVLMVGWTVVLAELVDVGLRRIIYAPDTRGVGLVVGAAMATYLWQRHDRLTMPRVLPWLALAGFAAVSAVGPGHQWIARGLLLGVTLLSAIIIVGVLDTGTAFSRMWSLTPLVFIGKRAYGIYLWHFPVFHFLTTDRFDVSTPLVGAAKIVATLAVVEVSYRFVEKPALRLRHRTRVGSGDAEVALRRTQLGPSTSDEVDGGGGSSSSGPRLDQKRSGNGP